MKARAIKRLFLLIFVMMILSSFFGTAAADIPDYGQPLVLPNATYAADPMALRVNDRYYLYPTTLDTAVECWSSTDLAAWTYEGIVWGPAPSGAWNYGGICAPDVLPYAGQYYMYYNSAGGIGVAVADAPAGPFVDAYDHPLVSGFFTIDPDVFVDEDGQMYLYSTCARPFGSICVSTMSDPVTLTGGQHLLFVPGILNWEGFLVEGPWMLKHDGTYYLMYSGNQTIYPFYAIGYATSDNPLGPFVKYSGNPILRVDWANDFWGPGHNSVAADANGMMWMFYHTKVAPQTGWDREVRINRIAFDADDILYVVLDDDDDTIADDTSVDDDLNDDLNDDLDDDTALDDDQDDDNADDASDDSAGSPSDDDNGANARCGC